MAAFLIVILTVSREALLEPREFLTEDAISKLETGEILLYKQSELDDRGHARGGGLSIGLIDAPPENVWDTLRAVETHTEFFPRLRRVDQYLSEDNTIGLDCTLKVAWKKVDYHVLQTFNPDEWTMTWRLDESKENDIEDTFGAWILVPHNDNQTIVFYRFHADTGMFIPGFLERHLINRDLPEVVRALKKRVESGGEWER